MIVKTRAQSSGPLIIVVTLILSIITNCSSAFNFMAGPVVVAPALAAVALAVGLTLTAKKYMARAAGPAVSTITKVVVDSLHHRNYDSVAA